MEYIKPVDPAEFMVAAKNELDKCVTQYFREISLEEAAHPEILDAHYTEDYLERLVNDYYNRLEAIWSRSPLAVYRTFSSVYHKPAVEEAGDPSALSDAYKDASRRTLWERLTCTNHKDVTEYKELLHTYGESLLKNMLYRFSDAIISAQR